MTNEEFLESISEVKEMWKPVVGWEDYYAVSNLGKVVSLYRIVYDTIGRKHTYKAKLLTVGKDRNGYLTVNLSRNNKNRPYYIHRLIASSFVENPKPSEYTHVDHIDGNILNNSVQNLRWCSLRMNLEYPKAYQNFCNAMKKRMSENPNNTRAVVAININNPNNVRHYKSQSSTQKDGFNPQLVNKCCKGKYKQHFGYKWMYQEDYENLNISDVKELLNR